MHPDVGQIKLYFIKAIHDITRSLVSFYEKFTYVPEKMYLNGFGSTYQPKIDLIRASVPLVMASSIQFCEIFKKLAMILKENSFQFNGRHYLQTHGTAMGTNMAVAFANVFMAKIEKGIISKSKINPLVWKRYIDDVFCVWHTTEDYRKFCAKGKQLPRYNQIYG